MKQNNVNQPKPKWQVVRGYRGTCRHVWDDRLDVCVREDFCAREYPYVVIELQREVARFAKLKSARLDCLRRINLEIKLDEPK